MEHVIMMEVFHGWLLEKMKGRSIAKRDQLNGILV